MSADLNKRIAELEQQLHEAQEIKYNLQYTLGEDTTSFGIEEHEKVAADTRERLQEMAEARQALVAKLEAAKTAADTVPDLQEQISAANDVALSKQGALDEVMMAVHVTEAKLADLENAQGLLAQELELAKANEEYVGGLQKKIANVAEDIAALNADLQEVSNLKVRCEQDLFQALKTRQQLNLALESANEKAESILHIENRLTELDEVMTEEQYRLDANDQYVNELREAAAQQNAVNETNNAELAACNERIFKLAEALAEARAQIDVLVAEENATSDDMSALYDALNQCTTYDEIYKLEESFNKVGMTIQKTTSDRMILCRYQDNKIVTEAVVDDFIFIGPAKRLHEGMINKIMYFIQGNEGPACAPSHEPVTIMNEDKKFAIDYTVEAERSI